MTEANQYNLRRDDQQTRPVYGCYQVLAWIEQFAKRITFQELPRSRTRQKNRCILEFRGENGQLQVCGANDLCRAVWKAAARSDPRAKHRDERAG